MRTAKFNIAVLKTNQTLHKFLFIISISELVTIIITRKLFTLPFYQEAITNKTDINPDQGGGGGGVILHPPPVELPLLTQKR